MNAHSRFRFIQSHSHTVLGTGVRARDLDQQGPCAHATHIPEGKSDDEQERKSEMKIIKQSVARGSGDRGSKGN